LLHYIENTGDTDLVFSLKCFKSSFYQDLSLSEWLAHTPPELVMAHLGIDKGDPRRNFPRMSLSLCRAEGQFWSKTNSML